MSCEKVIDVDLNNAEQVYVVEGVISNFSDQNFVKITQSAGFYDSNDFNPITGAIITISDQNGNTTTFSESSPGYYSNVGFTATAYMSYDLEVNINGEIITASTTMPGNTVIDSIPYRKPEGGFFGDGYVAFVYWKDDGNESNYYKINNYRKTSTDLYYTPDDQISVTEDRLSNGIATGTPIFSRTFDAGDSVIVDLMEIDDANYKYWYSLSQVAGGQSAAPGNPVTNLSGNTLGFFGAYNISRDTIVIEE